MTLGTILGLTLGIPRDAGATANADQDSPPGVPNWDASAGSALNDDGGLLESGISAQTPRGRAQVVTVGGYDTAHATPLFQSRFDLRVVGRLTLMGAVGLGTGADQASIQPRLDLRYQLLSEAASGLDLAVGGGYRRDRYRQDDGMCEVFAAASRRFGRYSLLASGAFGADLEGDDRKGNFSAIFTRRLGRAFQAGLAVNGEVDLGSTDVRRTARGDSSFEVMGGALGTYTLGPWALLAEAGPSVIETDRIHAGLVTLGGVGAVF
jgi:hypothetical protein